jgi:2'-5' RNA ligase
VLVSHTESSISSPATGPTLLRDHWQWRPEWVADRACLLWYLTFESQSELSRRAEQVHACLGGVPSVDVVPPPWLHLTLDDVGFLDELGAGQVAQVDELGDGRPSRLDEFAPHVTLAYLNDACEPETLMGPLGPVAASPVVVAESRLTLASVTRRDRHYQWTPCAEVALT